MLNIHPNHRSYVEVTLHPNSASAFKAEAEDVAELREIRAELLRKEAEAEEKRQKKIREAPGCSWLFGDRSCLSLCLIAELQCLKSLPLTSIHLVLNSCN